MYCAGSNTCAALRPLRMSAWPRQLTWSSPNGIATADGPLRLNTRAGWRSTWTRSKGDRAAGLHCAPCVCWIGTRNKTDSGTAGRLKEQYPIRNRVWSVLWVLHTQTYNSRWRCQRYGAIIVWRKNGIPKTEAVAGGESDRMVRADPR